MEGPEPSNLYESFQFALDSIPPDAREHLSRDPIALTTMLHLVISGSYIVQTQPEPDDSNLVGYDLQERWQNAIRKLSSQYVENATTASELLADTYAAEYYNQFEASLEDILRRIGICPNWPFCPRV